MLQIVRNREQKRSNDAEHGGVDMYAAAASTKSTAELQGRARRLRTQAVSLSPILAEAYERRAHELDLQAWLEAAFNPPIDPELDPPAPAPARIRAVA